MSVYTECSAAARELVASGEPFTEIDVAHAAALADWTEDDWREAGRHAPQILSAFWRRAKIVRFGPVVRGGDRPDYVRKDEGFLVVAGVDAWQNGRVLSTPNGNFTAIRYGHDPLRRDGRPPARSRD